MNTQVLITGAGPTGLTLALWLRRQGVSVRIIDKSAGPGETSRALAVQSRTLEFHRQLGIVDEVLAEGVRIDSLAVRTPKGVAARLKLGEFGAGVSPYPYAFALPQDVHERILVEHLKREGVRVERRTTLVAFTQNENSVEALIECDGATQTVSAAYLCGADGAHSAVRHILGLRFPGGTYEQKFYVADVIGTGDVTHGGMDVNLGYGFGVVMPVRQNGSIRLIGVVPKAFEHADNITFEDIRAEVERDTGVTVQAVNWFSAYRVHHRVAQKFRVGRVFIAGDAGHVHSPAGGQGMNTGIGDAVNLAWKLAAVLQGRANAELLKSYEPERIAFAHLLIKSTDQAFRFITSQTGLVVHLRRHVLPKIMGVVLGTKAGGRTMFGLVSQTRINYRESPLSEGRTGKLRGGDRLPYMQTADGDNHEPLSSMQWQVHVYGKPSKALTWAMIKAGIKLHAFKWTGAAKRTGFKHNAIYLVRPDGHIATIARDAPAIVRYLARFAITPRADAPALERSQLLAAKA
jgi:2-polyprenyl-6-methoxyphenol hydroxylase-like FAD-dependent oxidoreductase